MSTLPPDPFARLPRKHFRLIAADPPWHFHARTALQMSNWTSRRDAEKHYDVMGVRDIGALPVSTLAHSDGCHLFLWATGPCLPQAFEVLAAWGFRYSAIAFTWVKFKKSLNPRQLRFLPTADGDLHVGLGLTTRKNSEICLLGRRGNCKRLSKKVREIILAPVREHSRKPDEAYDRMREYAAGPYLDLFSRSSRPGWTSWGNETGKFDKPYDADDDFAKSIDVAYEAVRDRVANGGPGWTPGGAP
jgi:N6-adenosine-specific RNA methylase IME4